MYPIFDGVVDLRHLTRGDDLIEGGVGIDHEQIVVERAGEEDGPVAGRRSSGHFVGGEITDVAAGEFENIAGRLVKMGSASES